MQDTYNDRKDHIVHVALQLVSEYGMKKLTMKNIAEKVGFTDAALYRHFKSKHDIMEMLIDTVSKNLFNIINEAVATIEDPVDKLRAILHIHLSHIEKNKGMPRIIFSESIHQNDPVLRKMVLLMVTRYLDLIKGVFLRGKEAGRIRKEIDIDTAAVAFFGLVQSTTLIWSLSNFDYALSDKADSLFKVFAEGIL